MLRIGRGGWLRYLTQTELSFPQPALQFLKVLDASGLVEIPTATRPDFVSERFPKERPGTDSLSPRTVPLPVDSHFARTWLKRGGLAVAKSPP